MLARVNRFIWSGHSCGSEAILFCSRKLFIRKMRFYYKALKQEEQSLAIREKSAKFKTMVLIGAGPIPYTALYYRKFFEKVVCLERSTIAFWMAKKFMRKKKQTGNIELVKQDALDYDFPHEALIYVSLLTKEKQAVCKKAAMSKGSLLCLRLPNKRSLRRYEQVHLAEARIDRANLPQLVLESFLIRTNKFEQKGSK